MQNPPPIPDPFDQRPKPKAKSPHEDESKRLHLFAFGLGAVLFWVGFGLVIGSIEFVYGPHLVFALFVVTGLLLGRSSRAGAVQVGMGCLLMALIVTVAMLILIGD